MDHETLARRALFVAVSLLLFLKMPWANEICEKTLTNVPRCPTVDEYKQRADKKCSQVCEETNTVYKYHCMPDSSKTHIVEFCAKPKVLFGFCSMYDREGQSIELDISTLCNTSYTRIYYNSSDLYFCDPSNCHQLHLQSVTSLDTQVTTETTLKTTRSPIINSSWFSQYWYVIIIILFVFSIAIIIGMRARKCIINRRQSGESLQTSKKNRARNKNGIQRRK